MTETTERHQRRDWTATARTLSEALPHLQRYVGQSVVVKFGGHAMGSAESMADFARDVALMRLVGINPIVVHGGGPQIGAMLKRLQIESDFVDGLRVTDAPTVEVVEMVLAGKINKEIVSAINAQGGKAVGLSGKDAGLIRATKHIRRARDPESNIEKVLDIGFVGDPAEIRPGILHAVSGAGFIPVVAPVGVGDDGHTYNINADTAAGAIAAAVGASRLLLLTDVPGVKDADGTVLTGLTGEAVEALITDGTISGGMIPKVRTALDAIAGGVGAAVILDGRAPHAVLLELFTEHGAGTLIRA